MKGMHTNGINSQKVDTTIAAFWCVVSTLCEPFLYSSHMRKRVKNTYRSVCIGKDCLRKVRTTPKVAHNANSLSRLRLLDDALREFSHSHGANKGAWGARHNAGGQSLN